jgi:hypothetical protein
VDSNVYLTPELAFEDSELNVGILPAMNDVHGNVLKRSRVRDAGDSEGVVLFPWEPNKRLAFLDAERGPSPSVLAVDSFGNVSSSRDIKIGTLQVNTLSSFLGDTSTVLNGESISTTNATFDYLQLNGNSNHSGSLTVLGPSFLNNVTSTGALSVAGQSTLGNVSVSNFLATGPSTLAAVGCTTLNATGASTLAGVSCSSLNATGASTLAGVSCSSLDTNSITSTNGGLTIQAEETEEVVFGSTVRVDGDLYGMSVLNAGTGIFSGQLLVPSIKHPVVDPFTDESKQPILVKADLDLEHKRSVLAAERLETRLLTVDSSGTFGRVDCGELKVSGLASCDYVNCDSATVAGTLSVNGSALINGDLSAATLFIPGSSTLGGGLTSGAHTCTTLNASDASTLAGLTCTSITDSGALDVKGASTFAGVTCQGLTSGAHTCTTLNATGASTLAGLSCTSITDSGALTVLGASTLAATNCTTLNTSGDSRLSNVLCTTLQCTDALGTNGDFATSGSTYLTNGALTIDKLTGVVVVGANCSLQSATCTTMVNTGNLDVLGSSTLADVNCSSITDSGTLNVTGATTLQALSAANINCGSLLASGSFEVKGVSSTVKQLFCTAINNSGPLTVLGDIRAGPQSVTQDTAVSCYAQYSQTTVTTLSVPLAPAQLLLTFNTALAPFNVQISSPTLSSFTILNSGLYRCVFSINGEMSADRDMLIYLRKNGAGLRQMRASRLGTRSAEFSFNELIDLVASDVLTIALQAGDAAFTFQNYSATFNIEKVRKNFIQ